MSLSMPYPAPLSPTAKWPQTNSVSTMRAAETNGLTAARGGRRVPAGRWKSRGTHVCEGVHVPRGTLGGPTLSPRHCSRTRRRQQESHPAGARPGGLAAQVILGAFCPHVNPPLSDQGETSAATCSGVQTLQKKFGKVTE